MGLRKGMFFFEKKAGPPIVHVMPAKAGIHDCFAALGSSEFVTMAKKSWMPAFAGMTAEGVRGGRLPMRFT
jgi:hypothetical protein